jgi:hypothetical protein
MAGQDQAEATPGGLVEQNPQAVWGYAALTPAEFDRLWKAADRLDEPVWRDLARFLIAIPCRRGDSAGLVAPRSCGRRVAAA